jgi:hypothetical protein
MRLIAIVLTGIVSILLASSAPAQVIHACVKDHHGYIRIVNDPNDCRSYESPISWNVQGPPGPAGPTGPMGEPGPAQDIGEVVRIEIPATTGFDRQWFVPNGKALLTDHIAWSNSWASSSDPMEVAIRHVINISGATVRTTIQSTSGFHSFQKPLVLPAATGFEAPGLNNTDRIVYIYGRLVDADSALLSGAD